MKYIEENPMQLTYGIVYRDEQTYKQLAFDENGQSLVFPNKENAEIAMKKLQKNLTDLLYPRVEYRVKRRHWFKPNELEPIPTPKLEEWQKRKYIQIKTTASIEKVSMYF